MKSSNRISVTLRFCLTIIFNNNNRIRAKEIIDLLPENEFYSSPLEIAIAYKRIKVLDKAHTFFSRIFGSFDNNPDYLHNFAQVKISIANDMAHRRNPDWHTIRRIRKEAIELLRRALSLSQDTTQRAWCYFDLARTLMWQKVPNSQVEEAFQNAIELLPYEQAFREAFDRWRNYSSSK